MNTKIELCVTFFNELLTKYDTFDIATIILKETPIDIVIGRNTVRRYQLFDKVPSQLKSNDVIQLDRKVGDGKTQCLSQPSLTASKEILTVSPPHSILSLIPMSQNFITRR